MSNLESDRSSIPALNARDGRVRALCSRSVRRVIELCRRLSPSELAAFGTVGLVSFLIDVAVFNGLLFTVCAHAPVAAKVVSTVVASCTAYALNRHWTWRDRVRLGARRELPAFVVVSAVGLAITELCLLVSHYGLGLTSKAADNIAANVAGLALATLFRFWGYRRFVFLTHDRAAMARDALHAHGRAPLGPPVERASAET